MGCARIKRLADANIPIINTAHDPCSPRCIPPPEYLDEAHLLFASCPGQEFCFVHSDMVKTTHCTNHLLIRSRHLRFSSVRIRLISYRKRRRPPGRSRGQGRGRFNTRHILSAVPTATVGTLVTKTQALFVSAFVLLRRPHSEGRAMLSPCRAQVRRSLDLGQRHRRVAARRQGPHRGRPPRGRPLPTLPASQRMGSCAAIQVRAFLRLFCYPSLTVFRDHDELRFSTRSVLAHFRPYANRFHILTSDFQMPYTSVNDTPPLDYRLGLVPQWLNSDSQVWTDGDVRLSITHQADIFNPYIDTVFNR